MDFPIISGCDAAEHFKAGKATFYGVALFVSNFIVFTRIFGVGFGRDDHLDRPNGALGVDIIRVICLIRQ